MEKQSKRRPGGAPGTKILVTTLALAGTLGGWAALTRTSDSTTPAAAIEAVPTGSAAAPAIPTVVPPPDGSAAAAPAAAPVSRSRLRAVSAPASIARTRSSR